MLSQTPGEQPHGHQEEGKSRKAVGNDRP
jgi:hypothetical protein